MYGRKNNSGSKKNYNGKFHILLARDPAWSICGHEVTKNADIKTEVRESQICKMCRLRIMGD